MTENTQKRLSSICVYCGSSTGADPIYEATAVRLGQILAENDIRLVYGGGSIGLMGTVASATLNAGGKVTGIIPRFLEEREVMLREVDDLIVTENMHERKMLMFQKADAFVALPGGIGTLEEVVEMMTWAQLGQHKKPVLLANTHGFWSPLLELLDHMRAQAFIRPDTEVPYLVADNIEDVVSKLRKACSNMAANTEDGCVELSKF